MKTHKNILDILLDEDNKMPIVLTNNMGRTIAFEQVAIIPRDSKLYCVLKPLDHIDGINDDEAVVFFVEEKDGEPVLMVETDELVAIDVFEEYYTLLAKARRDKRG